MACSMCSGHGLNSEINANFARNDSWKMSRGQSYVASAILISRRMTLKVIL